MPIGVVVGSIPKGEGVAVFVGVEQKRAPIWRRLLRQAADLAEARTLPTVGMMIAARMPMIAMTVSNSIRVKARRRGRKTEGETDMGLFRGDVHR